MTSYDLKQLTEYFQKNLKGNRITNFTIVNSRDYVLAFSICKDQKMLISLNHQDPFINLFKIDNVPSTTVGQLNDTLRKEIKDGYIVSIEQINNDRILKIHTQKSNDYYEKVTRILILELIPFRPNLIITDENNKIVYAAHATDINASRIIMKGMNYVPPESIELKENEFNKNEFDIKSNNYWIESQENRLKERFEPLFQHIKIKIKSIQKKIKVLNEDSKSANDKLKNEEIGNMILAYAYDLDSLKEYVKENNIDYNETLSPGNNASNYFKKYKKAKRTIEFNSIELEKAQKELEEMQYLAKTIEFYNEDELIALAEEMIPNKFKNKNSKKKTLSGISVIEYQGFKILFGKNSKKNDELTFKQANKNDLFMHVKDYHGSHVIIKGENPSNEVKLLAAEICLTLSNTTAGDIQYTEVKNVKKSDTPGKVNLLSYQLIHLNDVRQETKEIIKKARNI